METPEVVNEAPEQVEVPDNQGVPENEQAHETEDMFPRKYVEELRAENAKYRDRAKKVEVLEQRLHAALVAQDGRLEDPTDLPFDAAHLEDDTKLKEAIAELIARKPHLKARKFAGDVGAGTRGDAADTDLLSLIRGSM